jgi:hypothetical protein
MPSRGYNQANIVIYEHGIAKKLNLTGSCTYRDLPFSEESPVRGLFA